MPEIGIGYHPIDPVSAEQLDRIRRGTLPPATGNPVPMSQSPQISQERINLVRSRVELEREIARRESLPVAGTVTRRLTQPREGMVTRMLTQAESRSVDNARRNAAEWDAAGRGRVEVPMPTYEWMAGAGMPIYQLELDIPMAGRIRLGLPIELIGSYEDIIHRRAERLYSIETIITDRRLIEIRTGGPTNLGDSYFDDGKIILFMGGVKFYFMRNIMFQPMPYPNIMVIPR